MAKKTEALDWDSPENEATNSFVGFNEIGDHVLGTLIGKKKVPSTLSDQVGKMQNIYTVKVRKCVYHVLDDKKKVVEEPVVPDEGDIVSVGGRKSIDSRMENIKIGQVFGLKYKDELPSKKKGYNAFKLVTVFVPKDDNGDFEMDQEWLDSQNKDELEIPF